MQGILQGSSLACRGGLLQFAYKASPQRFVFEIAFTHIIPFSYISAFLEVMGVIVLIYLGIFYILFHPASRFLGSAQTSTGHQTETCFE